MAMWKSVFGPKAHVYGVDINKACKSYEDNQTKIFIGDQESPSFWEEFRKQVPRIDILIDDGGHTVEQQIATLGIMLPYVSPDGVYITEDVHGEGNGFWQNLQFETLSSPGGKKYTGLNKLISSAHVYPYLLVLELSKNTGTDAMVYPQKSTMAAAMVRELGTFASEQPSETQVAVVDDDAAPAGLHMQMNLRSAFPWLRWKNEKTAKHSNVEPLLEEMLPKGWLFVRDGREHFSFDAPWDAQSDAFMHKMISDFSMMHAGNCCNWNASPMQEMVDSLHFYPHLMIAQRTGGGKRLIKAPQHGTQWIPY